MSITITKINNEKVKPIKYYDINEDNRPIMGADLFEEIYANIFIASKKKSGKTCLIGNIIKKCATTETVVIIFSSTINKDSTFKAIREYCENKKIPFLGYMSLYEDGVNKLDELIEELGQGNNDDDSEDESEEENLLDIPFKTNNKKRKKKRPKYRAPEYLIVLDDLSTELKDRAVESFAKKNRHYKAKFIISSQYLNDLSPSTRKQIDYFIIFKAITENKLQEIYRDADLSIPFDLFVRIYKYATKEKYSFLYISTRNEQFRINFNKEIKLPQE